MISLAPALSPITDPFPSLGTPVLKGNGPEPTISVLMTAYNGMRFLKDAIESVLGQTFRDFELIVVDDGSTDDTARILAAFEERDPRVVVITQPNQGIAAAMNRALQAAKCDLVAHIDHDDRALPGWLESQMNFFLQHPDSSIVCSYGYFVTASGKRFGKSQNLIDVEKGRRELNPSYFLELIHSTVLMRKDDVLSVGGYRKAVPEDRDLWGRIVTAGMMIRCNPVPLVEYRLHGRSLSTRQMDRTQTYASRGLDLNVVRRLKGEPELTPLEIWEMYRRQPLRQRWHEYRRVTSGVNFRLAARHYSEGQWFHLARRLTIAVALRPVYILTRARTKLRG